MDPATLERLRSRLVLEHDRLGRGLERLDAELSTHRRRVGERAPCAYGNPDAAREDREQAARTEARGRLEGERREVERALTRLDRSPGRFGRCEGCEAPIPAERLEILPHTRLCARCADRADG